MSKIKLTDLRGGLERPREGYLVKYDQVQGVAVSPDSGFPISCKKDSVYVPNYKMQAAYHLGADISYRGNTLTDQLNKSQSDKNEPPKRLLKSLFKRRWFHI